MNRNEMNLELKRIKKNIENSWEGFRPNYERYSKFRKFVFLDSMSDGERAVNNTLQKNNLQFNMLEAYLNKILGEFMKNEPELLLSTSDDYQPQNAMEYHEQQVIIDVLSGHLRHIFDEAKKEGTKYNWMRDILSGGYSSGKIYTEYASERSFIQDIKIKRCYDQTLIGFDMLASSGDKSDGDYCFEIVPYRKEDFEREFKGIDISSIKFKSQNSPSSPNLLNIGPFSWAYKVGDDQIILVADYFEKKKTRETLVSLSDGRNMLYKDYKKELEQWESEMRIDLPPVIVNKRSTTITKIIRYRIIDTSIIDVTETNYPFLPIKFIDGNSVINKDTMSGSCHQSIKPYFYHAEGAQKFKNYCGQTLANEIENLRPATIVAALESLPSHNDAYMDAYRNPQNTSTLVYNAFFDGNPAHPLPAPALAPRAQIPAEIAAAFAMADTLIQNILGAYDSSMTQLTENQMSGKAINEINSLSMMSAMPYLKNYLLGIESIGQMIIDMIPLYYKTSRSIPIIDQKGKRSSVMIGGENGLKMDYQPGDFKLKIEPGVSFSQQQTRSMQLIVASMNANPAFGEFTAEKCLDLYVDALPDMRNKDEWQARSLEFMQEKSQMKQAAMQAAQSQPNIEQQAMQIAAKQVEAEHQVGMAKVQSQMQSEQLKASLKTEELAIDREKLTVDTAKIVAQMHIEEQKLGIEQQKADDERVNKIMSAALKQSEHHHDKSDKAIKRDMEMLKMAREHEKEIAKIGSQKEEKKFAKKVKSHEKKEIIDEEE